MLAFLKTKRSYVDCSASVMEFGDHLKKRGESEKPTSRGNKNLIKCVLAILAITALFTSCEQDDDMELIIGKWQLTSMVAYDWFGKEVPINYMDNIIGIVGYIFSADGTVSSFSIVNENERVHMEGSYSFKNKIFTTRDETMQEWQVTKLTATDLTLENDPTDLVYQHRLMKFKKMN